MSAHTPGRQCDECEGFCLVGAQRWSNTAPTEAEAIEAAARAAAYLRQAVRAYEAVGFGSHVTDPLRDAIEQVEFSISEATS